MKSSASHRTDGGTTCTRTRTSASIPPRKTIAVPGDDCQRQSSIAPCQCQEEHPHNRYQYESLPRCARHGPLGSRSYDHQGERECSERDGGDGGGCTLGFPPIPIRVEFKVPSSARQNLGSRITQRRRELGLSRGELACLIGVHVKTLRDWELERAVPQYANRERLSAWIATG